jgi:DnaJ-class molecular chaperone
MSTNKYHAHQQLLKKFKLECYDQIKGIRIFERHVGTFFTKNGARIKINKKGMADAYAILPTKNGLLHIEIEIKTGKATQTKEQKVWESFIKNKGGIYLLVRDDYHIQIEELKNRVESLIN